VDLEQDHSRGDALCAAQAGLGFALEGLARWSEQLHHDEGGEMAENNLTNTQFKLAEPLRLAYDRSLELVAENSLGFTAQVSIQECDLDVQQARALRDWLNSVLPDEPKAKCPVCDWENGFHSPMCSAVNRRASHD
jgi:hypothetical protein